MAPDDRTRREIHSQVIDTATPGSVRQSPAPDLTSARSASDLLRGSPQAAAKSEVLVPRSPEPRLVQNGNGSDATSASKPTRSPRGMERTPPGVARERTPPGVARSPEIATRPAPPGTTRSPEQSPAAAAGSRVTWPRTAASGSTARPSPLRIGGSPSATGGSPTRAPRLTPRRNKPASPTSSPVPPSPRTRAGSPKSPSGAAPVLPPQSRRRSGTERTAAPLRRPSLVVPVARNAATRSIDGSGWSGKKPLRVADPELCPKAPPVAPPPSPSSPEAVPFTEAANSEAPPQGSENVEISSPLKPTRGVDRMPFREIQLQAVSNRHQENIDKKPPSSGVCMEKLFQPQVKLCPLPSCATPFAGTPPRTAARTATGNAPGATSKGGGSPGRAPLRVLQRSAECRSLGLSRDGACTPNPVRSRPFGSTVSQDLSTPLGSWGNVTSTSQLAEPSTSTRSAWSLGGSDESPGTWSAGLGSNAVVDLELDHSNSAEGDQPEETRETAITVQSFVSAHGLESPLSRNVLRKLAGLGGEGWEKKSDRDTCQQVAHDTIISSSPPTPSTPFFGSEAATGCFDKPPPKKSQVALADALQQLRRNTSLIRLTNEEISCPASVQLS